LYRLRLYHSYFPSLPPTVLRPRHLPVTPRLSEHTH
jgi:hypothetical protein